MDEEQKKMAEELLFSAKPRTSPAKQLFFGAFAQTFFPFPETEDPSLANYLQKVTDFLDKNLDPVAIDRQGFIPDSVIKGLAEIGVLGMTVPKEYQGLGMSQHAYCRVMEIISARCGSTSLFVNVHQSIGLKSILLFGTEEQKAQWLAPLAKGELLAAFSLTEPNAGSDAGGVETRAVYDPQRKTYKINGKKQWTTSGGIADILTVMARTEIDTPRGKEDKITAFLVTPEMRGFKVTNPALEKVGMRGTRTANLEFRDLEVPESNVVGKLGQGLKVCLTVLDFGRTTFGATCTGSAKRAFELALQHAKTRYQFKRPLSSFGLVKKKLSKMAALIYAMESTTYFTAGLIDHHAEEFMLESAILKVFASEALWDILYDTMQILGGRSFFTDAPYERMMRDARLNMIGEGSNEVMRAFIAAVGLRDVGMYLKESWDSRNIYELGMNFWKRFSNVPIPVEANELKDEAKQLKKILRKFGFAVVRLLIKFREEVLEHQLSLERISDAVTSIFTMSVVLSRIDSELKKGNRKDLEVAKRYCRMALDSAHQNLSELFSSLKQDQEIESLADQLTGKQNEKD